MAQQKKFVFKNDKFRRARGGTSKFLNIHCSSCRMWLLLYQKDGPGQLLRLYLDRIHAPENLASLQYKYAAKDINQVPSLICLCNAIIAHPMIYVPENRLAYRLIPGSFSKQNSNSTDQAFTERG